MRAEEKDSLLSPSDPTATPAIYVPHNAAEKTYTVKVKAAGNDTISTLKATATDGSKGITGAYADGVLTFTVATTADKGNTETFTLTAPGYAPQKITVAVQKDMKVSGTTPLKWSDNVVTITIPATDDPDATETFKVQDNDASSDLTEGLSAEEETPGGAVSVGEPNNGTFTITVTSAATVNNEAEKITVKKAGYADLVITVKTEAATPPVE